MASTRWIGCVNGFWHSATNQEKGTGSSELASGACHSFPIALPESMGVPWWIKLIDSTKLERLQGRKLVCRKELTGMEIVGIGTEIVECPRIGKMVENHGELFLRRVYTEREIRYCQSRKHAIEHFAGLWAAKEAIFKAVGTHWSRGVAWTDIEVRKVSGGRQKVYVGGQAKVVAVRLGIADIMVSISHCRNYATAYAMALASSPRQDSPPAPGGSPKPPE